MASLFSKQAQNYAQGRPTYPPEMFTFIASKTPCHDLVWDVGTGSGQAATTLAKIYKKVVATDTSPEQLSFAPKLSNITYVHTPPKLSLIELHDLVAEPSTVDLVTVAQAVHWFDLPVFYENVKSVLTKPNGVLAVWGYVEARVETAVDSIFWRVFQAAVPFSAPELRVLEDGFRGIEFPFDPTEGEVTTGPFEFETKRPMDLSEYVNHLRSWSAYQTAKDKGIEILTDEILDELEKAWGGDSKMVKEVKFPVFLRIGKVG